MRLAHRGMETNEDEYPPNGSPVVRRESHTKPNAGALFRTEVLTFAHRGMESNIAPALLRKRELAKLLNVCPRTIENLMRAGLPHLKPSSRLVLFNGDDALGWFQERFATKGRPSSYQPRVRQAEEGTR